MDVLFLITLLALVAGVAAVGFRLLKLTEGEEKRRAGLLLSAVGAVLALYVLIPNILTMLLAGGMLVFLLLVYQRVVTRSS
ncbi:hypothetical protein [Alkalicoccus chagannorensis]|uniref:hypothetical protein n=1 Tax=Alkalicoccus chagannorensis TaxID=427072 RepID=UPI000419EAA8|nr:hypothetical protein [Alkalicoccus chagannorensis]